MAEYINKQQAVDLIEDMIAERGHAFNPHKLAMAVKDLKGVEIARCKDCKYFSIEGETTKFGYCNNIHEHDTDPNGYCHHGENQVTGKLNNPDDSLLTEESDECKEQKSKLGSDLISRQAAIDALGEEPAIARDTDEEWAERDSWVMHRNAIASLPPVDLKPIETPLVFGENAEFEFATMCCEDCISRADIEYHTQLEARGNGQYEEVEVAYKSDIDNLPQVAPNFKTFCGVPIKEATEVLEKYKHAPSVIPQVPNEDAMKKDLIDDIQSLPPVEPKRPKTTETMMVDGEPTEIDPLSYEVGYTHGQFSERPKGKWIRTTNPIGETIVVCSNCRKIRQQGYDDFCGFCGADMKGEEDD